MSNLQMILSPLPIIALIIIAIWECAKARIFFTFLAKNQGAMVESGDGNPVKFLANLSPGWDLDRQSNSFEIIPISNPDGTPALQKKNFLQRRWGLYWIGPPWRKIKIFKLLHERMRKNITDDTKADQWIDRDDSPKDEWFILINVVHHFLVPEVELQTGYLANLLVSLELMLRKPLVPLYQRAGNSGVVKFYDVIGETVTTTVDNALRGVGYDGPDGLLTKAKNANSQWCIDMCTEINLTLKDLSGYEALKLFIPTWGLSTSEQQDLVREKARAQIAADVLMIKAQGENARSIVLMEEARKKFPNATDAELIAMVTETESTRNIRDSKVTVYAPGGNLAVGTQPTQDKGRKGGPRK